CACSAQNPSGSSAARFHSFSYSARLLIWAFAANSAGGGNCRVSFRTLVIFGAAGEDIAGLLGAGHCQSIVIASLQEMHTIFLHEIDQPMLLGYAAGPNVGAVSLERLRFPFPHEWIAQDRLHKT